MVFDFLLIKHKHQQGIQQCAMTVGATNKHSSFANKGNQCGDFKKGKFPLPCIYWPKKFSNTTNDVCNFERNWGINAQNHWFAEENVWCFFVCCFLLQQCDLVGKDKGASKWQNEKRKAEEKKVDFSSLGGATPSAKLWPSGRSFYLAKQTCMFFKW